KMWLSDDLLISPDGQYLAATGIDESVGSGESFQVWSLTEKKQIVDIKHKAGNDAPDYAITFLDATHLLVHNHVSNHDGLQVLDVAAGKIDRTITLQEPLDLSKIVAVSPGGKYFAAMTRLNGDLGQCVFVVDLASGKTVGESQVPLIGHFHSAGFVKAMAFSRDGKEIAALFATVDRRLIIWDVASGKVTANMKIAIEPGAFDDQFGRYLEYAPDGKRLRISHFLIDRGSGETVETIPPPPGDSG